MSTAENQFTGKIEEVTEDKIQALKNQISIFQKQNESLKKEEQKMEEIKRNLLGQNNGVKTLEEENADGSDDEEEDMPPHLSSPDLTFNQKEYEQFIVEDAEIDEIEEIEDEMYSKDEYIEMANAKIDKLESEIYKLRKCQKDDQEYIRDLESDITLYEAPKRRIQQLENQIENIRHQYLTLSAQFRNAESTHQAKEAAYDSMKANFLKFIQKINAEKTELEAKFEAKEKENQALMQIISHLQTSLCPATVPSTTSVNVETASLTNTQTTITTTTTTDESMDLSNGPATPAVNYAVAGNDYKKSSESSPEYCF